MTSFYDDEDEALNLAIKASLLEQEQDLENPAHKQQDLENPARKYSANDTEEDNEAYNDNETDNDTEADTEEEDDFLNTTREPSQLQPSQLQPSQLQPSKLKPSQLGDYNQSNTQQNTQTEDEMLSLAMAASLNTIEEDRQRYLKKQSEEDEILSKVIEESYASNVAAQFNSGLIINNSLSNEFYEDEAAYMRVVLQQIKEDEEREAKLKVNKQRKMIIEEQDFEYEEALRQDKENAKKGKKKVEKKVEKKEEIIKSSKKPKTTKPKKSKIDNTFEKIISEKKEAEDMENVNDMENEDINVKDNKIINNEDSNENPKVEKPKTLEEIRKARLAFFDKK